MFKFICRRFSDNKKLEEAKKRAMQMYEKLHQEEQISLNRQLEEEVIKKSKEKEPVNSYKIPDSKDAKEKVEELVKNFKFIDQESRKAASENLDLNYFNKVRDGVLMYKLNDTYKSLIDKEKWVKMYEAKYDPNFEKFINFMMKLLQILIFYKTLYYVKKYFNSNDKEKNNSSENINKNTNSKLPTKKETIFMILFYSLTLGTIFATKSFTVRLINKIMVKNDKVRIFLTNENKTKQNTIYKEINIEDLKGIKSRGRNFHVIYYSNEKKNKILQLFALKNGFYDRGFLANLCHPNVKSVKFTNVNI